MWPEMKFSQLNSPRIQFKRLVLILKFIDKHNVDQLDIPAELRITRNSVTIKEN